MNVPDLPADLSLSPSLLHRRLLSETPRALSHEPGMDFETWRRRLRRSLRRRLGADLDPARADRSTIEPRRLWTRQTDLGVIEKITFEAEPASDWLGYWCVPYGATPPYAVVICLQGHTTGAHVSVGLDRTETHEQPAEGDRDFALGCMRRGLAALCIEQRSFGDRGELVQAARSTHPCHDAAMQGIMLGRTLAAQRVFDVDRGLDYLRQRGDVNPATVGVMGNSGGGTVTLYAAATLSRLRWAMPSCSFCTFADSIMSIHHCADNYVPGLLRDAEAADVLGLFAPRPVVVVAGKEDPIFPIAGVRRAVKDLRRIYAAESPGRTPAIDLVVGPDGHRFYADLAWKKAMRVVDRLRSEA